MCRIEVDTWSHLELSLANDMKDIKVFLQIYQYIRKKMGGKCGFMEKCTQLIDVWEEDMFTVNPFEAQLDVL